VVTQGRKVPVRIFALILRYKDFAFDAQKCLELWKIILSLGRQIIYLLPLILRMQWAVRPVVRTECLSSSKKMDEESEASIG